MRKFLRELKKRYFVASDRHDKDGYEIADPTPVEFPIGFKRPLTLQEQIQRALRSQMIIARQQQRGEETLEESMDYDMPEEHDPLPASQHQVLVMQEEFLKEGVAEEKRQARRPKPAPAAPATAPAPETPPKP